MKQTISVAIPEKLKLEIDRITAAKDVGRSDARISPLGDVLGDHTYSLSTCRHKATSRMKTTPVNSHDPRASPSGYSRTGPAGRLCACGIARHAMRASSSMDLGAR